MYVKTDAKIVTKISQKITCLSIRKHACIISLECIIKYIFANTFEHCLLISKLVTARIDRVETQVESEWFRRFSTIISTPSIKTMILNNLAKMWLKMKNSYRYLSFLSAEIGWWRIVCLSFISTIHCVPISNSVNREDDDSYDGRFFKIIIDTSAHVLYRCLGWLQKEMNNDFRLTSSIERPNTNGYFNFIRGHYEFEC